MSEVKDDSSGIVQRLEELNQWQEEQKRILFERQNNQRKLLGLEHRKMYETLGIYHAESGLLNENDESEDESSGNETDLGVMTLEQSIDEGMKDFRTEIVEKPKRPFLRRKQGLINRFKVDPDQFRLDNLPPYKFYSIHPSLKQNGAKKPPKNSEPKEARSILKSVLRPKASDNPKKLPNIDAFEEKFQKSLISSQNACNSTPDMKSQCSSTKQTPEPISWATILDPHNMKPFEKSPFNSTILESQDDTDNISIFELLEQKAKDGSFDLNSSCIKKFLRKADKYSNEEKLESPITLKLPPIPYEMQSCSKSLVSDLSDTEVDEEADGTTPRAVPRVHFADDPIIQMKQTVSHQPTSALDNSDASQVFQEFKKLLFANQNDTTIITENGQGIELAQEILQKTELIRARLSELEAEISIFKQNNLELVRSKQEHELQKAHFEQERIEAAEKLNDERIQMEIYLHDERMKIEADRHKMEKQIRNQKALCSGKEKREISKLQEEIDSLQKEMKKKEDAHVAAQSRLRAQVRNLEKDVRQLNTNIDALEKENKRLESENLKINRQNNNKILQEINRNIAKLAPKVPSVANIEEAPPTKLASVSKQHSTAKFVLRRRSSENNRKASPLKRQDTPVNSSDDDLSNTSSDERGHQDVNSKVTFAMSPTLPQITSIDKVETNESLGTSTDASFKREILNPDGSKDIWYPNGNLKKITSDGMIIRMLYFNKDIKETNINEGTVKYYYAETNTWHTTYLDGLEILEFPNGQTEHRYKDGKIEIYFPNNSIKVTNPLDENKLEEWRFADGSSLIQMKNGDKILLMANGQKEIHTAHSKRREYPDGTVKLLYPDGSQETRYSNGRVRLKDKDGNLVMDTENVKY